MMYRIVFFLVVFFPSLSFSCKVSSKDTPLSLDEVRSFFMSDKWKVAKNRYQKNKKGELVINEKIYPCSYTLVETAQSWTPFAFVKFNKEGNWYLSIEDQKNKKETLIEITHKVFDPEEFFKKRIENRVTKTSEGIEDSFTCFEVMREFFKHEPLVIEDIRRWLKNSKSRRSSPIRD